MSFTVIVPLPVIPVPEAIATNKFVDEPVPVLEGLTSDAANDVLNIVGSLLPSTTINLSLPSKLYTSKS